MVAYLVIVFVCVCSKRT